MKSLILLTFVVLFVSCSKYGNKSMDEKSQDVLNENSIKEMLDFVELRPQANMGLTSWGCSCLLPILLREQRHMGMEVHMLVQLRIWFIYPNIMFR